LVCCIQEPENIHAPNGRTRTLSTQETIKKALSDAKNLKANKKNGVIIETDFECAAVAAYREKLRQRVKERADKYHRSPHELDGVRYHECRWFLSLLDEG